MVTLSSFKSKTVLAFFSEDLLNNRGISAFTISVSILQEVFPIEIVCWYICPFEGVYDFSIAKFELEYVGISSHVFSRKLLDHFSPHTVLVQAVSITAEHEDSIVNT
jgi:hypothetical protein